MKLQNVTDKADPKLVAAGFDKSTFVVAGKLVAPGTVLEVEDNAVTRAEVAHLLKAGALVEVVAAPEAPAPVAPPPLEAPVAEDKVFEDRPSRRGK
jgi:hypothetical protein